MFLLLLELLRDVLRRRVRRHLVRKGILLNVSILLLLLLMLLQLLLLQLLLLLLLLLLRVVFVESHFGALDDFFCFVFVFVHFSTLFSKWKLEMINRPVPSACPPWWTCASLNLATIVFVTNIYTYKLMRRKIDLAVSILFSFPVLTC